MSTYCNYWNKVSLVRSKIKKSKKIDSIGIGLASPEEIRRWGERRLPNGTFIGKVDKDHTVDYESLKPIEGGLFCERIFGPVEDFYCSCERKGEKNEKFCPNCEVEFTKSRVRRIRMGYIPLAVPVAHVWYLRGRPSYIANLIGKSRNSIDRLAYGETLSESFIGSSFLESIYKKEENFFSKKLYDVTDPITNNQNTNITSTFASHAKRSFASTNRRFVRRADTYKSSYKSSISTCKLPFKTTKSATYISSLHDYPGGGGVLPHVLKYLPEYSVIHLGKPLGVKALALDSKRSFANSLHTPYGVSTRVRGLLYKSSICNSWQSKKELAKQEDRDSLLQQQLVVQPRQPLPLKGLIRTQSITLQGVNALYPYRVCFAYSLPLTGYGVSKARGMEYLEEEQRAFTPTGSVVEKLAKQRRSLPLTLKGNNVFYKKNSVNKLTTCFFSHTVVTSTGFIKNIYCSHLRFISLFTVPMQKVIQNQESIRFVKQTYTYFSKPVVVLNTPLRDYNPFRDVPYPLLCVQSKPYKGKRVSAVARELSVPYKGKRLLSLYPVRVRAFTPTRSVAEQRSVVARNAPSTLARELILRDAPYPFFALHVSAIAKKKQRLVDYISKPNRYKKVSLSLKNTHPKVISNLLLCKQQREVFGHRQKYLKCHTLPLFSTFVYKEWSHRFSFLEYFIWSARNNDLVLPFYAYQNSRSEKRLINICESIRKNSLNLIRNKFSLRFSNKSNISVSNPYLRFGKFDKEENSYLLLKLLKCETKKDLSPADPKGVKLRKPLPLYLPQKEYANLLHTPSGVSTQSVALQGVKDQYLPQPHTQRVRGTQSKVVLQKQKVQPRFLQLRNKQGVLRFSKVNKKKSFLFHTKPNFYDIKYIKAFDSIRGLTPTLAPNYVSPFPSCASKGLQSQGYRISLATARGESLATARGKDHNFTSYHPLKIEFNKKLTTFGNTKDLQYAGFAKKSFSQNLPGFANTFVNKEKPLWNWDFTTLKTRLRWAKMPACNSTQLRKPKGVWQFSCHSTYVQNKQGVWCVSKRNDEVIKVCSAFSTIQQDTESTPLNKIDTQQFPRLTELLNFTGGAALRNLLSRFDLIVLSKFLRHELKNLELKVNTLLALKMLTYSQGLLLGKLAKRRSKQIRRLKLLELFQSQKSNPEWMILSVIPVLPPDLRPILRVNDDFVVASDLNRLYQTVLRRNNTIHERLDDPLPCPESGLFRQRSLQKAVDGLLENGKGGGTPLCASKRRPLVSLSHVLKGKKGLFRQHLLGKRVDYSGRSVIVVGPRLQLHECGLPKEMATELFQPFLLHRLKVKGLATSNTTARRMIQQGNPVIWHLLKQLVYEHPVLLNRAPTLHRLGIQAFQPRLVSGRAILLHPLVCNGFNADFDGDQMAVHVPLSFQARAEAWKIMWSKNNFLSPATGQPILVPSQDMVLGCYYLSVSIPRILNVNVNVVSSATLDKARVKQQLRLPHAKLRFAYSEGIPKELYQRVCKARSMQSKTNLPFVKLGVSTPNQNLHSKAFLNENKGQYFSNLQDSLLAYFQGRLQTHTPFWVRIDFPAIARGNSRAVTRGTSYPCKATLCLLQRNSEGIVSTSMQSKPFAYSLRSKRKGKALLPLRAFTPVPFAYSLRSKHKGKGFMVEKLSAVAREKDSFHSFASYTPLTITRVNPVSFKDITSDGFTISNNRICDAKAKGISNAWQGAAEMAQTNLKRMTSNHDVQYASYHALVNRPNRDNLENLKALKLTFLQPLYGSSREMCKILFQNKSTNSFQIRIEANETLESPLELRLNVNGDLANILTMFQNHYNYNATWVKQCKEESIKYMRTTAGRVVINQAVFKDF